MSRKELVLRIQTAAEGMTSRRTPSEEYRRLHALTGTRPKTERINSYEECYIRTINRLLLRYVQEEYEVKSREEWTDEIVTFALGMVQTAKEACEGVLP